MKRAVGAYPNLAPQDLPRASVQSNAIRQGYQMEQIIMLNYARILSASAIVGALAISSGVAFSQQTGPAQPQGSDKKDDGWRGPRHQGPMASELVEARIAYLKTALQITQAQTAQFNAVADFMRKEAKDRDAKMAAKMAEWRNRQPGDHPRRDPIEMLEHRQKMMQDAAARLGQSIAVWKPLYASLTDSQKQLLPALIGHHDHEGWGHGKRW